MNKADIAKYLAAAGLSASAALSGGYLIANYEGEVRNKAGQHVAYIDAVGVHTACYGQTGKDLYGRTIRKGMTYSDDECLSMLANTVRSFQKEINYYVRVPYKSSFMEAALISFAYNVGVGNFSRSTLLKDLNNENYDAACNRLVDWVYAKGIKLNGLVTRRGTEKQWCLGNVDMDIRVTFDQIVDMVKQAGKDE